MSHHDCGLMVFAVVTGGILCTSEMTRLAEAFFGFTRIATWIASEGVNAGEKMHRRAGVKMHHGASSQRPVQLHILI
jgi:hypothetical protein